MLSEEGTHSRRKEPCPLHNQSLFQNTLPKHAQEDMCS